MALATNRSIRVQLSRQSLEAMQEICEEMISSFKTTNDHQFLLKEYLREFQYKLTVASRRQQETYTLSFGGTESVAFYQLWHMLDIKHDKYATVIVETLLKKIAHTNGI